MKRDFRLPTLLVWAPQKSTFQCLRDRGTYGPTRHACNVYGPLPYLLAPCGEGGSGTATLVYEGPNMAATLGATSHWRFVQGGGVDDPVLGLYREPGTGIAVEYAWITDGAGRQLAAGSWTGALTPGSPAGGYFLTKGGSLAGGTAAATSYGAERQATAAAPELSHLRHRVYDQQTGRWLQEDPLGIAGGLNLYQFNGSNPTVYSDPFGLCKPWPDCWFQAMADRGVRRGGAAGALALNVGASLNAASEAFGTNELGAAIGEGNVAGAGMALATMLPVGKLGKAGRLLKNLDGGAASANEALSAATKWLGEGYREIAPGVFRSADNTRQFRMVGSNLEGATPHVNFEVVGAGGRKIIENSHVRIIDP